MEKVATDRDPLEKPLPDNEPTDREFLHQFLPYVEHFADAYPAAQKELVAEVVKVVNKIAKKYVAGGLGCCTVDDKPPFASDEETCVKTFKGSWDPNPCECD
jgi:hypothetical protein